MTIALVILAAVAVVLGVAYSRIQRSLVSKDNECDKAWRSVDEQLVRRCMLVPRFIDAIQTEGRHAAPIPELDEFLASNDAVLHAETPEAKMRAAVEFTNVVNAALTDLDVLPEVPDELREEFDDLGVQLSCARAAYNECVATYNAAISTPPGSIVGRGKFLPRQAFEAVGDTARHPVLR